MAKNEHAAAPMNTMASRASGAPVPETPEQAPAAPSARVPGSGRLLVVGTPIGNLGDLSPRAGEAFASADAICCEDTRVTSKLLARLGVSKPLMRCDENTIAARAPQLVDRMLAGERIAFASDAGMPSVSDPGQVLVDAAREAGVDVEVLPGPSACVTALVASGVPCDHFFFEGFPPRKHGERVRRLRELAPIPGALIFYESPHRIVATLAAAAEVMPERAVAVCRELTKLHEEVLRGTAAQVSAVLEARGEVKGEIALVVAPPTAAELAAFRAGGAAPDAPDADPLDTLRGEIETALAQGESVSSLSKRLAQRFSLKKRTVYELALQVQDGETRG